MGIGTGTKLGFQKLELERKLARRNRIEVVELEYHCYCSHSETKLFGLNQSH